MTRGFYRILVFLFLIVSPGIAFVDLFATPECVSQWLETYPVFATMTLIGIGLQPISAVGLWWQWRWGFVVLIVATILSLPSCSMAMGPILVFFATYFRSDEAKCEQHRMTHGENIERPLPPS